MTMPTLKIQTNDLQADQVEDLELYGVYGNKTIHENDQYALQIIQAELTVRVDQSFITHT